MTFCHIISIPVVRIYLRMYVHILNLSSYFQFNTYSTYVLYIYVLYVNTKKHFEIIKNNIKKKYKYTILFHSQLHMFFFHNIIIFFILIPVVLFFVPVCTIPQYCTVLYCTVIDNCLTFCNSIIIGLNRSDIKFK